MTVTNPDQQTPQIKFISRIVKAGDDRKVITVPVSELAKVQDLAGKHVLVTLEAIL